MCQVLPGLASCGTFRPYLYDRGGVGEEEERRYLRTAKKRQGWMRPIHKKMITLLREKEMSAEGLSDALGISAEEVHEYMSYSTQSLDSQKERFIVRPSRCQACGYVAKGQRRPVLPDRCRQCQAAPLKRPGYRVSSTDLNPNGA